MTDIRYVIVSDLHFGADNSMLTTLIEGAGAGTDTGFAADASVMSPVLSGLVAGLRLLTRDQERPPTLILAGDVLDLALSPDEVSATVFSGFARLAWGGAEPVFDPVAFYLPGNHDHHLWETARENQYLAYICSVPADEPLGPPWHTTKLEPASEAPEARSAWLTGLVQRQPGCSQVEVRVSYPNLAVRTTGGERCVVVSHGHFTESIYTLMSRLKDVLYPDQRPKGFVDIDLWEEENFAWIDFLWSTLGRSGQVGSDLGLIYADMTSPTDLDALVANVTASMLGKGKGPRWIHPAEHWALNSIFKREVNRLARSERGTPTVALTPKGQAGLQTYLEGPVHDQLQREWGQIPAEVTFVFGHTHKPFVDRRAMTGFSAPVRVFNTGGWVVDTATPAPVQAGVAVLVSDDLDVASLQCYRQGSSPPAGVQILGPAPGDTATDWQQALSSRIDGKAEPWVSLTAAAAELTAQRHRLQQATAAAKVASTAASTASAKARLRNRRG